MTQDKDRVPGAPRDAAVPGRGSAGVAGGLDSAARLRAEEAGADYEVALESLNQWQLAARKFRRHRLALVGLGLLATLIGAAIVGPFIWPFDFYSIPAPDEIVYQGRPPSLERWFGETGGLQRDVFTLVINGARTSLLIGFSSMLGGVLIGTFVGSIAGFFGGFIGNFLMRVVDVFLSLPLLFLILVASRFFGNGNVVLIISIFALFSWMGVSRLVRSLFLTIREREFIEAARAVGVRDRRIIFRHILPNAISPIVVVASLLIAANIIAEAFVSFLGFGVNPLTPTWGNILTNALTFIPLGNWWWPFFPGLMIILTVLGVNFVGDGLRDALDPRSRL
jgi:peptide/nickel transport system permease protein